MVRQRNRKWVFGLSSAAFLAFLGYAIDTWIGTMNHIGAEILFACSGLCLLVSIFFGCLLWRHRKDEVAPIASTEIRPSKTKNLVDQPDTRLMESLSRARVGAERLLKLKADTAIEGRLVYTPDWEKILDIETTYRSTIERLTGARSNDRTEYGAGINSLIKSLQRGKSIIDAYRPEKDMSAFKDELDANSKEIIEQVDGIFRLLLEPITEKDKPNVEGMAYSLQIKVVGNYPPDTDGLGIKIRLKNTSGKPLRYQVKTLGVKLDNISPDAPNLFNNGGIIHDEGDFTLPMLLPKVDRNLVHHGIVDLTIDYGRPDDRARRRMDISAILNIGETKTDSYWRRQKEDSVNVAFTDEKPTWQPVVDIAEIQQ